MLHSLLFQSVARRRVVAATFSFFLSSLSVRLSRGKQSCVSRCLCVTVLVISPLCALPVTSNLTAAITAGAAMAGRMFAGKAIGVQYIPEAEFRALYPSLNFA
jgi:hypothetical protein